MSEVQSDMRDDARLPESEKIARRQVPDIPGERDAMLRLRLRYTRQPSTDRSHGPLNEPATVKGPTRLLRPQQVRCAQLGPGAAKCPRDVRRDPLSRDRLNRTC
jgi:hypothetical protein